MKYKNIITCDKCKKEIKMPNAVIEQRYDNKGSMHVCCHDCALGNNPSNNISDMALDQKLYSEDFIYERLKNDIPDSYGSEYMKDCKRIIKKIFE